MPSFATPSRKPSSPTPSVSTRPTSVEHYRPEMMDSAGHVMLGAIAGRTERIRLGTAMTVLSTPGPGQGVHRVRDARSYLERSCAAHRRARLATESFPLFGFDLADYEALFKE
jgi:hypothetical protein